MTYCHAGLSVIPVTPEKRALVKWKQYQTTPATEDQVRKWWSEWPDAGTAAILGPASGLFAIDIDGPEAWQALLARIGTVSPCPASSTKRLSPPHYETADVTTRRRLRCLRIPDSSAPSNSAAPIGYGLDCRRLDSILLHAPSWWSLCQSPSILI